LNDVDGSDAALNEAHQLVREYVLISAGQEI
jgi:hypothetical protein